MIRAIVCPPDVPENYEEILVIFAEVDARRGKSGTMMHFGANLLETLRKMPMADRLRSIKQLCSNLQDGLLQSSSKPDAEGFRETGKFPDTDDNGNIPTC